MISEQSFKKQKRETLRPPLDILVRWSIIGNNRSGLGNATPGGHPRIKAEAAYRFGVLTVSVPFAFASLQSNNSTQSHKLFFVPFASKQTNASAIGQT